MNFHKMFTVSAKDAFTFAHHPRNLFVWIGY